QLGIAHSVADGLVAEVRLQRSGIDPVIGEFKAGSVAQHMRMDREAKPGGFAGPLNHAEEACGAERRCPLAGEDVGRLRVLLALEPPQGAEFIAPDRMHGIGAALEPANVEVRSIEIDLRPLQGHQLAHTQTVPIAHQDHGAVPVTVPVFAGGLHELLDLGRGQVLASPVFGVGKPPRCPNCSVLVAWSDQPQRRFGLGNWTLRQKQCSHSTWKTNSNGSYIRGYTTPISQDRANLRLYLSSLQQGCNIVGVGKWCWDCGGLCAPKAPDGTSSVN